LDFVNFCNWPAGTNAGVIHQYIQPTERLDRRLYCGLTTGNGADVTGRRDRVFTVVKLIHRGTNRLLRTAVDRDQCARLQKRFRNTKTDTATASRYQDPFIREIHLPLPDNF
jgi:hypothetical protein